MVTHKCCAPVVVHERKSGRNIHLRPPVIGGGNLAVSHAPSKRIEDRVGARGSCGQQKQYSVHGIDEVVAATEQSRWAVAVSGSPHVQYGYVLCDDLRLHVDSNELRFV